MEQSAGQSGLGIDTNILIAYLRGQSWSIDVLTKAVTRRLCFVSSLSVYELYYGAEYTGVVKGEPDVLAMLISLPFDDIVAKQAARLRAYLIRSGQDIGINDALIAGTFLSHNLPLLTANYAHFNRVPNLHVISPVEFLAIA